LVPATYEIELDPSTIPAGYEARPGSAYLFRLYCQGGDTDLTNDFPLCRTHCKLGDRVWDDGASCNGVQTRARRASTASGSTSTRWSAACACPRRPSRRR